MGTCLGPHIKWAASRVIHVKSEDRFFFQKNNHFSEKSYFSENLRTYLAVPSDP